MHVTARIVNLEVTIFNIGMLMFKNRRLSMISILVATLCSACGGGTGDGEKNNVIQKRAGLNAAHIAISESSATGSQLAVFSFAVDSDELDEVSYSLVGNANDYFSVDEMSAEITLINTLDFENQNQHTLNILASSTDGTSISSEFIVTVEDYPVIETYFPAAHGAVTEDTISIFGKVHSELPESLTLKAVIGSESYAGTINEEGGFQIDDVPVSTSLASISLQVEEGIETGRAVINIKKTAAPRNEPVGTGASLGNLLDIALHRERNKLYVADFTSGSVIEVDVATGNRTTIYSSLVMALTLDEENNRLIFSERDSLYFFDLDTRQRSLLTECIEIDNIYSISLGVEDLEIFDNQLYALNDNAVVKIELDTGECEYLYQGFDESTNELIFDSLRQRIYVAVFGSASDRSEDRIDAIDIQTGARFPVSHNVRVEVSGYLSPQTIFFDEKTDSIYALESRWQYIARIAAHNGAQGKVADFLLYTPGFEDSPGFNMEAAVVESDKNRVFFSYRGGVVLLNLENFEFEFISQ